MFCPACGNENKDTATFCIYCGCKIIGEAEEFTPKRQITSATATQAIPQEESQSFPTYLHQGRYLVEKELGAGGMGRVLLAFDQKMKSNVVIKEMHQFLATAENRKYLENRFITEAQMLFSLKHAGLPKVLDYFVEGSSMYLVMEYLKGKDLAKLINDHPSHQIAVHIAVRWMRKILEILKYLHNQNPPIIHRDIKPSNLMLTPDGNIYLLDFGIARTVSEQSSAAHTSVGTFGYASPEHFSGRTAKCSDIYSLGATFHHLLSGEEPQNRDPFVFPPLSIYRSDVPESLERIILTMTAQKKESRYQSAEEVLAELDRLKEFVPQKTAELPGSKKSGSLSAKSPANGAIQSESGATVSTIERSTTSNQGKTHSQTPQPQRPQPAVPVVSKDDTRNTLSASTPLGKSVTSDSTSLGKSIPCHLPDRKIAPASIAPGRSPKVAPPPRSAPGEKNPRPLQGDKGKKITFILIIAIILAALFFGFMFLVLVFLVGQESAPHFLPFQFVQSLLFQRFALPFE